MHGHLMLNVRSNGSSYTCHQKDSELDEINSLAMATNMSSHVIGVALVDDRTVERLITGASSNYHILGVILLDSLDIIVKDLRKIMYSQLPGLPKTFNILTKQGWPLLLEQETRICVSHIINANDVVMIKKRFDRPRIGVQTTSGDFIGFIFIDAHCSVFQVREAISEQLRDVRRQEYRFIERNGWPVGLNQERILALLDILWLGQCICVQYGDRVSDTPILEPLVQTPTLPVLPSPYRKKPDVGNGIVQRTKLKLGSLHKKKDHLVAKPILISYVRAEAAEHALHLKEELADAGFSVYLDVHEIKNGCDWQDALNYAVSHCQFFVPLITPMYGKTQWTNREIKLADGLQKVIIPISFLEQWPPECLAIQFVSTQYIPWKPQDPHHPHPENEPRSSDIRVWDRSHIKWVCEQIAERCKAVPEKSLDNEMKINTPPVNRSKKRAGKSSIKACDPQDTVDAGLKVKFKIKPPEKELIVISAHPKQKVLIHQLKVELEKEDYDVWCSSEQQESQEILIDECLSSNPNTPRELTSIPEGNTILGQAYNDIANTIADSKRGSLVRMDHDSYSERKPLTRMISQVSDISQVSSLTPDKIERLKTFQQKADLAGIVIIIVSEAYTKSKTSQQQVFYCEHRKQVVLVRFDQSPLPSWFTMLMGNDMITNVHNPQFITTLKAQVKRTLNPYSSETPMDATAEAKIQCFVNFMKKNIPKPETCVYIAGSSKLLCPRTEEIARAIGKELAKVKNITVCTGGFYGAPEIVATTFFETLENNDFILQEFPNIDPVIHVLPRRESGNFSKKARQNADGSFETLSYGKTVFVGDSVKDRETAVARMFDTCIVIEGGPGAAHEVEEFIWNDHFVIPIISTGGAAGGQYGVPLKIFEAPPCVSTDDWLLLSEKGAEAEEVAKAVVNIVIALKQSIATHINSHSQTLEPQKNKNKARTKSKKSKAKETERNKSVCLSKRDEVVQTHSFDGTYNGFNSHRLLQRQDASYSVCSDDKYNSRWQKFLRVFSVSKCR